MFIRFSVHEKDRRTDQGKGVFTVAYELLDGKSLYDYERALLRQQLDWFKRNLPVPTRYSRKKNVSHRETKGICWFRSDAEELVGKVREIVALLEQRGFYVETILTDRPGYIVYEDSFQVVAEPFGNL